MRHQTRIATFYADAMLLVIFGAGASYDYAPSCADQWRPPLANALFEAGEFGDALKRYPQFAGLVPHLRGLPSGVTVEEKLDAIQTSPCRSLAKNFSRLMSSRYLSSGSDGSSRSA